MRRKKESEYHTGRLNISCPPSVKDAIAADATAQGLSISQYIVELYEKSKEAGTSEHLARMGLELLGIKKGVIELDTRIRRSVLKSGGLTDKRTADDLAALHDVRVRLDEVLKETVEAVKQLKEHEEQA